MRTIWDLPLQPEGVLVETDDGLQLRIRPIRPTDRSALLKAFERLSEQSRYQRFFSPKPRISEPFSKQLVEVDDHTHMAWAVFDPTRPSEVDDASGLAVASARLFVDQDDPSVAEATLVVVDEYQRRGLGRFLMELLISTAVMHDLATMKFEVLADNRGMRKLVSELGAQCRSIPLERGVVEYLLPVPSIDEADPTAGALYTLLRAAANDSA